MARLAPRKLAIAAAGMVSDVSSQTFANLGTAGTVVPVPANAWGVQITGTAAFKFRGGTALGGSPGSFPANLHPRFALHANPIGTTSSLGSVAIAATTGSADFVLNWLIMQDQEL